MYTSLGTAAKVTGVSKSTILRAMLLPLIPLAVPFRTLLRVLIILLVAIVTLYAIVVLYAVVVLLGFVGIHVPVPRFRWRRLGPRTGRRKRSVNHADGMVAAAPLCEAKLRQPPGGTDPGGWPPGHRPDRPSFWVAEYLREVQAGAHAGTD
jgi:hypothetical protein